MDFCWMPLPDWLKEMLVGGIMSNLSGMFDSVNQQVGDIATQVGQSPRLERQHFQYDPEPLQLHHGADCRCDPGYRDDDGADSVDYRQK